MVQITLTYPFTEEDKTFIRQILDGTCGKVYITAKDLGMFPEEVPAVSDIYGKNWKPSDVTKLAKLYSEGKTCPEIAEQFPGRTVRSINNKLNRMGLFLRERNK